MHSVSPWCAATTLYVPATAQRFMENILQGKFPFLPSVTLCLEDAIRKRDIQEGIRCIRQFLTKLQDAPHIPLIFIRPRDKHVLSQLVDMQLPGVTGFVLPKFRLQDASLWERALADAPSLLMPTLETVEIFDQQALVEMRAAMLEGGFAQRVIVVRVGGNDLQHLLGIARSPQTTIYEGAMGYVLGMLAATFIPHGLALSAPVCSILNDPQLLARELDRDILHGFYGKTVVHPAQLASVRQAFAVSMDDVAYAKAILEDAQPVFRYGAVMGEPAVQWRWARTILERQNVFGTK